MTTITTTPISKEPTTMPIQIQILTAFLVLRDQAMDALRTVRDDERGELTGNVIFLAALAVARPSPWRRSSSLVSTPTPPKCPAELDTAAPAERARERAALRGRHGDRAAGVAAVVLARVAVRPRRPRPPRCPGGGERCRARRPRRAAATLRRRRAVCSTTPSVRLTSGVRVTSSTGPDDVTVTVEVDVLQVFPIGDFDVAVSAAAPIERFVAEPDRP